MSERIGAIDQGTTSTRLVVFEDSEIVATYRRPHRSSHPRPGWVEQDAGELLANIEALIAEAGPLDALGLANQGESRLAWDAITREPLSPVIVWQDSRTAAELATWPAEAVSIVAERAGLPLDPYFSASKLAWIIANIPAASDALQRGRLRLGTTDVFFIDRLTGVFATDRATASRTSLMTLETGTWDETLCDLFGVPLAALPEIRSNAGGFGRIGGVPLAASIVDQQAALYGHGCRAPGECKITFGTGAFALAVSGDRPVSLEAAGGLLPTVGWDLGTGIRYAIDGGIYDVGSAIEWALRAGLASSVAEFSDFAAPSALSRGLVFIPAFSGLAAPQWDRSAAPLAIGMAPDMCAADLRQALLEAIALQTAALIRVMADVVPLAGAISIDGGVSQSPYFVRFLAAALQREVLVSPSTELTARGVAQLAGARLRPLDMRRVAPGAPLAADDVARFERALSLARGWKR